MEVRIEREIEQRIKAHRRAQARRKRERQAKLGEWLGIFGCALLAWTMFFAFFWLSAAI